MSELPSAYLPPNRVALVSALDQPALGIVLVAAALFGVPQAAHLFTQATLVGIETDTALVALSALMLGSELLLLLAALAVAWQWRSRRLFFGAALVTTTGLVVSTFVFGPHELGPSQMAVIAIESLGGPVLVLVAPRLFGQTRIPQRHALGGLLIVGALSTFMFLPIDIAEQARMFGGEPGGWLLGSGIQTVAALAVGVLELAAGRRMVLGQPARRWLAAYVIVALAVFGGLDVVRIVWWLFDHEGLHGLFAVMMVRFVISLAIAVTKPILVWLFAKREEGLGARVDAALPWLALWFVPVLAARCLLTDEMKQALGALAWPVVLLCAAQALASLIAARAALRDERSTSAWRVAVIVASALFAIAVYSVFSGHDDADGLHRRGLFSAALVVWPVALLLATMVTGVWLSARATRH